MPLDNLSEPTTPDSVVEPQLQPQQQKPKRQRLHDSQLERSAAAVDDAYEGIKKAEKGVKKAKQQEEDSRLLLALRVAECRRQLDAANDRPCDTWEEYKKIRFPKRSGSDLDAMLAVGRSADPPKALQDWRKRGAERQADHRKKKAANSGSMSHQKSDRKAKGWNAETMTERHEVRRKAKEAGGNEVKAVLQWRLEHEAFSLFASAHYFSIDERIELVQRAIEKLGLDAIVELKRLSESPTTLH